ncbi:selenocysteine insertion sequence-binding protein 2 isoform X2 [Hetaerina americana]|uniref:selenocysteine insertion sequence-binding protein 2 isoform X2 n=1 Tax=Hetaerina americana TaxID=62018 RepID=UPI003A7F1587
MLTKKVGSAWNSNKSVGDDDRLASGSWPQLGKQEGFAKSREVEKWPKSGGSHSKKKYVGNQELESGPRMGLSGSKMSFAGSSKSYGYPKERQESDYSENNEFTHNPTNDETGVTVGTSSLNHSDQTLAFEESEKEALSNKEKKSLDYKKLNKERKEERKAERRKKKEDDTLRKMLGPKGVKITVIDNNVFSKFVDQDNNRSLSQQTNFIASEVQLDSSAFPELQSSPGKLDRKRTPPRPKNTPTSALVGSGECTNLNIQQNAEISSDTHLPRSSKSKKRRDPVVVDIWKAIEICKSGKKVEEEEAGIVRVSRPKEKDKCRIAGNLLDASNPSRHRGKKRETPKKRIETRLKKAIMAERIRRREARCATKSDSVGNIIAPEVKLFNFSNETHTLDSGMNDLCDHPGVAQGSMLCGKALEEIDVKREEQIEECHAKTCGGVPTTVDIDKMTKDSLHSRSFREYCNHSKSSHLTEAVRLMLKDILKFQDRLHATQPIKAESHRRYVVGLRQTQHLLAVHKLKIIILAQDIEKVPSPGGLDEVINAIIGSANEQRVPVVFPLTRRQLGKVTYRKVGVSCVGVLNYQGSEENFKKIISALEDSKKDYEEKFEKEKIRIRNELGILPIKKEDCKDEIKEEEGNAAKTQEFCSNENMSCW